MKSLLLSFFLISGLSTFAQKPNDEYVILQNTALSRFDPFTQTVLIEPRRIYVAKRGAIFVIQSVHTIDSKKGYSIRFYDFNSKAEVPKDLPNAQNYDVRKYIDSTENGYIFYITDDELRLHATEEFIRKAPVTVSGIVLPLKLRFKNDQPGSEFEYTQGVNLGGAFAFPLYYSGPLGKTFVYLSAGLSLNPVTVDEKTTQNVFSSKTTVAAISPFGGLNVEINKIAFNALIGIEILTGKGGESWAYRNSPWVGLGLGLPIAKISKNSQ